MLCGVPQSFKSLYSTPETFHFDPFRIVSCLLAEKKEKEKARKRTRAAASQGDASEFQKDSLIRGGPRQHCKLELRPGLSVVFLACFVATLQSLKSDDRFMTDLLVEHGRFVHERFDGGVSLSNHSTAERSRFVKETQNFHIHQP